MQTFKFTDQAQAVRFAFTLAEYPGDVAGGSGTMVRAALAEVGIDLHGIDAPKLDIDRLRTDAAFALLAIHQDLLRNESAALTATYSRNWDSRRASVLALQHYYRRVLAGALDDPEAVDQLVTRHYIAERARSGSWAIRDIADKTRVARTRLEEAAQTIETHAAQLETAALTHLSKLIAEEESTHA